MACMLLLRMGYAPTAANAIENYNSVRVSDRLGLTVHSQKKWVRYYEDLLYLLQRGPSPSLPGRMSDIVEPSIVIEGLTLRNMLTGVTPPELRLRVFQLDGTTTAKVSVLAISQLYDFPETNSNRSSCRYWYVKKEVATCSM